MALQHAVSGDVVDVRPFGASIALKVSTALVRDDRIEVIRTVLLAGRSIPPHRLALPLTVQCIEGTVEVGVDSIAHKLAAGD